SAEILGFLDVAENVAKAMMEEREHRRVNADEGLQIAVATLLGVAVGCGLVALAPLPVDGAALHRLDHCGHPKGTSEMLDAVGPISHHRVQGLKLNPSHRIDGTDRDSGRPRELQAEPITLAWDGGRGARFGRRLASSPPPTGEHEKGEPQSRSPE